MWEARHGAGSVWGQGVFGKSWHFLAGFGIKQPVYATNIKKLVMNNRAKQRKDKKKKDFHW